MPAKRKYNTSGTKDFIVLAGIFFFLCLWAIKDAWYTSPKTLEKHPQELAVSFDASGLIGSLHVAVGDLVAEEQLIAELRHVKIQEEFEMAKKAYTATKSKHTLADEVLRNAVKSGVSADEIAELKQNRIDDQSLMDASLEKVNTTRARLDASELRAPGEGVVKEVLVSVHTQVDAAETVILITPKDHFYLFNKSLAIFSFIAFWVFLGIHILAQ